MENCQYPRTANLTTVTKVGLIRKRRFPESLLKVRELEIHISRCLRVSGRATLAEGIDNTAAMRIKSTQAWSGCNSEEGRSSKNLEQRDKPCVEVEMMVSTVLDLLLFRPKMLTPNFMCSEMGLLESDTHQWMNPSMVSQLLQVRPSWRRWVTGAMT